jgi:iron complex outermembrane receptor protein
MNIRVLWFSVSALALAWGGAASAQTTAAAPSKDAAGPSNGSVSEVVVTAERRSTSLQTTAISAEVLTGADLQKKGIVSVEDLQFATPSMTLQSFGQGNDFNIRGVGKGETNSSVGVGVITYRDGVAAFPGYFQTEPYYDIANIEVLRGPQGTFIGQNAIGGAVFITEANPNFDGFHGYLQGQLGNYNDAALQGAINIPINDSLAVRFAFDDEYRESFYDVTGAAGGSAGLYKQSSARFSLLWTPTSQIDVLFKADLNYVNLGGYVDSPATAKGDPFHITSDTHNFAEDKSGRLVLDASYTFNNGIKLRSVSGYQDGRTAAKYDLDGTDAVPFAINDHVEEQVISQELNLISPSKGFITWVAGLYYEHNKMHYPASDNPGYDINEPGVIDFSFEGRQSDQTFAQFGQVTFNLPAGLQIQAGLRNMTSFNGSNIDFTYAFPGTAPLVFPQHQEERDSKVTGKVALNWTIDPKNFVYAFVATGHKTGGVNTPAAPGPVPLIQPEDVTDYETGWKNSALSRHLRSQIDFYYYDYKNFEVGVGNPLVPTSNLIQTIPSSTKLYGLEIQEQAVFGAFAFDLGGSYAHSSLGTFFAADPRAPGAATVCNATTGPAFSNCVNLTGNKAVYAPTFTFNAGAQYVFTLANGTLTPRVDFGHVGTQWSSVFEDAALGDKLGVRNLLNAQLTYVAGSYTLTAYGTNLNDQHYISGVSSGLRFAGAPRQFGVRLQKVF